MDDAEVDKGLMVAVQWEMADMPFVLHNNEASVCLDKLGFDAFVEYSTCSHIPFRIHQTILCLINEEGTLLLKVKKDANNRIDDHR